jgi:FO synthase
MHAVARLVLHPHITTVQTSWVKMGPHGAQACLAAGANDLGGTLMNESITRAAGAAFGQELPPRLMHDLLEEIGRVPHQRTTLYGEAAPERVAASFRAAPLAEVVTRPPRRQDRAKERRLVRFG